MLPEFSPNIYTMHSQRVSWRFLSILVVWSSCLGWDKVLQLIYIIEHGISWISQKMTIQMGFRSDNDFLSYLDQLNLVLNILEVELVTIFILSKIIPHTFVSFSNTTCSWNVETVEKWHRKRLVLVWMRQFLLQKARVKPILHKR